MKSGVIRWLCSVLGVLSLTVNGGAQQPDPRVGLKPGLRDAGQAARNMELVASLPKPEGFFDPKAPAGEATPPETSEPAAAKGTTPQASRDTTVTGPSSPTRSFSGLDFANSDLGVQRFPRLHRQLQRFQYLRHRNAEEAADLRLGGVSRRAGGRLGARTSALHVGRADARTDRLWHTGSFRDCQRRAVPWGANLRHQRRQTPEADCGGADVPGVAHAHARHRPKGFRQPVHLRFGDQHGPVRRGTGRVFERRSEG